MDVPLSVRIASEIPWVSMAPSSASRLAWPLLERPPWPRHGSGSEGDLGHQALATEADHMKLAPGDQLIGEGPGDSEKLAGLGGGVDEAIVRCLWGADGCGHGRHTVLWTSKKRPQKRPQLEFLQISVLAPNGQGGQGRRSRGARRVGAVP